MRISRRHDRHSRRRETYLGEHISSLTAVAANAAAHRVEAQTGEWVTMKRLPLVLMRRTGSGLEFVRDVTDQDEGQRACRDDPSLQLITRQEALQAWTGDRQTLSRLLDGCEPCEDRKNGSRIERKWFLSDVLRCLLEGKAAEPSDLNAARTRLAVVQTEIGQVDRERKKLELAKLRAELLPADLVVSLMSASISAARSKALGIPSKLRNRHTELPQSIVNEMSELLSEALEELAHTELPEELREQVRLKAEAHEHAV